MSVRPRYRLFWTAQDIVDALRSAAPSCQMTSTSMMRIRRNGREPHAEPFRPGFLSTIDTRTELTYLLGLLDERSRTLLVLWFVEDFTVISIAGRLGISRVHCYRLRDKALRTMLAEHQRRVGQKLSLKA